MSTLKKGRVPPSEDTETGLGIVGGSFKWNEVEEKKDDKGKGKDKDVSKTVTNGTHAHTNGSEADETATAVDDASVASALTEGGNLSGFDYITLENSIGDLISWYNAQFYSGFGTFFPADQYEAIIDYEQGIDPARVTATVLTNPSNGFGYVSPSNVVQSIENLMEKYGTGWGGVGGWEYFNSLPNASQPWVWAETMKSAMTLQKAKMEAREKAAAAARKREEEADSVRVRSRAFRMSANSAS